MQYYEISCSHFSVAHKERVTQICNSSPLPHQSARTNGVCRILVRRMAISIYEPTVNTAQHYEPTILEVSSSAVLSFLANYHVRGQTHKHLLLLILRFLQFFFCS